MTPDRLTPGTQYEHSKAPGEVLIFLAFTDARGGYADAPTHGKFRRMTPAGELLGNLYLRVSSLGPAARVV